jgi:hypothetical protein
LVSRSKIFWKYEFFLQLCSIWKCENSCQQVFPNNIRYMFNNNQSKKLFGLVMLFEIQISLPGTWNKMRKLRKTSINGISKKQKNWKYQKHLQNLQNFKYLIYELNEPFLVSWNPAVFLLQTPAPQALLSQPAIGTIPKIFKAKLVRWENGFNGKL